MKKFKYVPLYQEGGYIPQVFTSAPQVNAPLPDPTTIQVLNQPKDSGVPTMLQVDQQDIQRKDMQLKKEELDQKIKLENANLLFKMMTDINSDTSVTSGISGTSASGTKHTGLPWTDIQRSTLQQGQVAHNAIMQEVLQKFKNPNLNTSDVVNTYIDAKSKMLASPINADISKASEQIAKFEEMDQLNKKRMETHPELYDIDASNINHRNIINENSLDTDPNRLNIENFRSPESIAAEMYKSFPQEQASIEHGSEKTADGNPKFDIIYNNSKGDHVSMHDAIKSQAGNSLDVKFEDRWNRGAIPVDLQPNESIEDAKKRAKDKYVEDEINKVLAPYDTGKKTLVSSNANLDYKEAEETKKYAKEVEISALETAKAAQSKEAQAANKSLANTTNERLAKYDREGRANGGYLLQGYDTSSEHINKAEQLKNEIEQVSIDLNLLKKNAENFKQNPDGSYQAKMINNTWVTTSKAAFQDAQNKVTIKQTTLDDLNRDNKEATEYALKQNPELKSIVNKDGNIMPYRAKEDVIDSSPLDSVTSRLIKGAINAAGHLDRSAESLGRIQENNKIDEANKLKNEYLTNKYKSYQEHTISYIPVKGDKEAESIDASLLENPKKFFSSGELVNENFEPVQEGALNDNLAKIKYAKYSGITLDPSTGRIYQNVTVSNDVPDKDTGMVKNPQVYRVYDRGKSADRMAQLTGLRGTEVMTETLLNKLKHNDVAKFDGGIMNDRGISIYRDPDNHSMYKIVENDNNGNAASVNDNASYNILQVSAALTARQRDYTDQQQPSKFIKANGDFMNKTISGTTNADTTLMIESGGVNTGKNPLSSARGHYQFTNQWTKPILNYVYDKPEYQGLTDQEKRAKFDTDLKTSTAFYNEVAAPGYIQEINSLFGKHNNEGNISLVQIGDTSLKLDVSTPSAQGKWMYIDHNLGYGNMKSLIENGSISNETIGDIRKQLTLKGGTDPEIIKRNRASLGLMKKYNEVNGLPLTNTVFTDDQINHGKLMELSKILKKFFDTDNYQGVKLAEI